MEVCELDPELVGVAENWFGFRRDAGRMTVHVGDGVGFIKNRATTTEMRGNEHGGTSIYKHVCHNRRVTGLQCMYTWVCCVALFVC